MSFFMKVLGFCIVSILAVKVSSEFPCKKVLLCPCGSSNSTYKFCNDDPQSIPNFCDLLSSCSRCEDYIKRCIECPEGFEGRFCLNDVRHLRSETGNVSGRTYINTLRKRSTDSEETDQGGGTFAFCRDPGIDENGDRTPKRSKYRRGFRQGIRLEYTCKEGFRLKGEKTVICLPSGKWSSAIPTCQIESSTPSTSGLSTKGRIEACSNPGSIENGKIVVSPSDAFRGGSVSKPSPDDFEFPEGFGLQYSCNDGYVLDGPDDIRCTSKGIWSDVPPSCRRFEGGISYCKNPGSIENGGIVLVSAIDHRKRLSPQTVLEEPEFPEGSRLEYSCKQGFNLSGSSSLTCLQSGMWSSSSPICRKKTTVLQPKQCENPGPIPHGKVRRVKDINDRIFAEEDDEPYYPVGTQLEYSCQEEYILEGPSAIVCESSGIWSEKAPECISECGHSYIRISRRVINGSRSRLGEWPWVVGISNTQNGFSELVCGGALISPTTVLTAAHCIVEERFTLYFGKVYLSEEDDDSSVVKRTSTQIITHPSYDRKNFNADIALIKFQPRVRYNERIQPVCLSTAESSSLNLVHGKEGYVTGWGITEHNTQANELMYTELPVKSNDFCLESYRKQGFEMPIKENMFCAGLDQGQRGACTGDSGSPFVFYNIDKNRFSVEGIVSFTTLGQCALPGRYTIFTRVYKFLPWIYRNM